MILTSNLFNLGICVLHPLNLLGPALVHTLRKRIRGNVNDLVSETFYRI